MITTGSLPAGVVNVAYSQTLTATNGLGRYTWSIVSGSLPAGLVLGPSTGVISGTPAAEGTSNVRVRVTTSSGQPDEKNFNIAINRAPVTTGAGNLKIKTESLSPGFQNSAYVQQSRSDGRFDAVYVVRVGRIATGGVGVDSSGNITRHTNSGGIAKD